MAVGWRQFTITACAGRSAYSASVPSFHERSDDEFVGLDAVGAKAGVDSRSASAVKIPSWHIEDNLTLSSRWASLSLLHEQRAKGDMTTGARSSLDAVCV